MTIQYEFIGQAEFDLSLWQTIVAKYKLSFDAPCLVLPHGRTYSEDGIARERVMWETRKLYFWQAVGTDGSLRQSPKIVQTNLPVTRIVSWGKCNVQCPYCKRDCQFIGDDGTPIVALTVPLHQILSACIFAHQRGEIVRFSGGDPIMYAKQTLAIAEYMSQEHQAKVSIAHNGTGTRWVEKLLPFLSSAAIDLKAPPEKIGQVMGVSAEQGRKMYQQSLETQKMVSQNQVLLDVRTPVFGDTTTDDMRRLAENICLSNDLTWTFWTWRLYKSVEGCAWPIPNKEKVIEQMLEISAEFPNLWLGIRAKWQRGGMEYVRAGALVAQSNDIELIQDPELGSGNRQILAPVG